MFLQKTVPNSCLIRMDDIVKQSKFNYNLHFPIYLNTIDKEDFLWNQNKQEKFFNQVSVSGHNILNLSTTPERHLEYFTRFDDLMSFVYDDFVKDNKYIQYIL